MLQQRAANRVGGDGVARVVQNGTEVVDTVMKLTGCSVSTCFVYVYFMLLRKAPL